MAPTRIPLLTSLTSDVCHRGGLARSTPSVAWAQIRLVCAPRINKIKVIGLHHREQCTRGSVAPCYLQRLQAAIDETSIHPDSTKVPLLTTFTYHMYDTHCSWQGSGYAPLVGAFIIIIYYHYYYYYYCYGHFQSLLLSSTSLCSMYYHYYYYSNYLFIYLLVCQPS